MNSAIRHEVTMFCEALNNLTEGTTITCTNNSNSIIIKIIKYDLKTSNRIYHLTLTSEKEWKHEIQTFLEFINQQDIINAISRHACK